MMKYLSALLSAAATAYTLWYMHFDKPWTNDGALSTIGLEHKGLFILWGVLTYAALTFAAVLAYRRLVRTKVYLPLLGISAIGMALTLGFDFIYGKKPDFYLHCAGSLLFSAVTGFTVFLLFLLCFKRGIIYKIFTVLTAVILLGDTVLLCIFHETGLIEAVPIFAGMLMLAIINFRRDDIEATRTAAKAR